MARITRATLTTLKAKGSAAALTVTATTFGLSGFAGATAAPYNPTSYHPGGDWHQNQEHKPAKDAKHDSYDYNKHGDKKVVEYPEAPKHNDHPSYGEPQHGSKPVEDAAWHEPSSDGGHSELQPSYNYAESWSQPAPEHHEAVSEHHEDDNCPPENKSNENHQASYSQPAEHHEVTSHDSDKDCPPEEQNHDYDNSNHDQHSYPVEQSAAHDSYQQDKDCPPCPPEDGQTSNYGHDEHSDGYQPSYESADTNTEKTNSTTVNVSNTVNQSASTDSQSDSDDSWGGEVGDTAAGNNANVVTYVVVYNS